MRSRNRLALSHAALLAVVLSWAFHLRGLAAPPFDYHYHRQTQTAAIARNLREDGLNPLKPRIDWDGPSKGLAASELPVYMWLMALLWPVFGLGDVWGRLLACGFSSFTAVYLLLFLEERGFDRAESLAGALLFSCLPLEIYFGRSIQPEAIALCATMAALYHYLRHLRTRSLGHAAAAAAAIFLAVGHKMPYAYIGIPLLVLTIEHGGWRAIFRPASLATAALGLGGAAAWYLYGRFGGGAYVVPVTEHGFWSLMDYGSLGHYVFFQLTSRFPELACTYAGLALGVFGIAELRRRGQGAFFGAWLGGIVAYLVFSGGYAFYHEYTSLPFAPVNAAVMGLGLLRLWRGGASLHGPARRWAAAGVCALALGVPIHAELRISHWYAQNFPYREAAAEKASRLTAPDALFIVDERASSAILYAIHRRGWSWGFSERTLEDDWRLIEERRRSGAAYLLSGHADFPTTEPGKTLLSRYPLAAQGQGFWLLDLRPEPQIASVKGS